MSNRIISYYGGKARLAETLIDWMPPHENYLEPFAGGLSVFFKKAKAKWNAVNDLDKDIANLYYVCSRGDLFEEFKQRTFFLIQSKEIYDIIRDNIKKKKRKIKIPDIQRAVDYFFYITVSFNNRPGTSITKNVNKWNSEIIDKLEWSRRKLDQVIIENLDINAFIKKYSRKKNAMWFFDPPYYVTEGTNYYGHVFNTYHHEMFRDSVDKLKKKNPDCYIMITYDDHSAIRRLFKDYHIKEVDVTYSSSHETIQTNEIVITNYKLNDKQQTLF